MSLMYAWLTVMLLPSNPSINRAKISRIAVVANPRKMKPINVLIWLRMNKGFLPNLSLSLPVMGLANSWQILNTLRISPICDGVNPSDKPRNGISGNTKLKPSTSVNVIRNIT